MLKRNLQEITKLQFLTNCKEVVPYKSTSEEASFEWSQPSIPSQIQKWSSKLHVLVLQLFPRSSAHWHNHAPLQLTCIHFLPLKERNQNLFCFVLLSEFSSRNPVLFARFIPNLLPPTQCEQLPSLIQEDRMLQEDLVTSQGFSR